MSVFGQDLLRAATFTNYRHSCYTLFMSQVVKHIVEGYCIHRQMTDIKAAADEASMQSADKAKPHEALGYVNETQGRPLEAISSVSCFKAFSNKGPAKNIEMFLSNLVVNPDGDANGRRISWLEFYILYRIRGGAKPIPDHHNKAFSRSTADKQIAAFKKSVRAVTGRTLKDDGDGLLFKPYKTKPDELVGCGILGKLPTLSCNVSVNAVEKRAIAVALSQLTRLASIKKHNNYINGHVNLIPHPLKLKGRAGWDSTIPTLSNYDVEATRWADAFKNGSITPAKFTMFYHCPTCNKVESSQRGMFQRVDMDVKHKCGFCKKSNPIKAWTCQCGTQWHSCQEHRGGYVLMPTGDDPLTAQQFNGQPSMPGLHRCATSSRKRSLDTAGGIRYDPKRKKGRAKGVKRMNTVLLGGTQQVFKRPARLGPILSERFSGASSSY